MARTSKVTRTARGGSSRKRTPDIRESTRLHCTGNNKIELSASSIVRVLKAYNRAVPIELVAAKLHVNRDLIRMKMIDLQRERIVTINGDAVKLVFN